MGRQTQSQVPTIDLSKKNVQPGTSSWFSTCGNVMAALEEYGCFVAALNEVPSELQEAALSAVKDFFELPSETKLRNIGNSNKPHYGYSGSTLPFMETFGIENAPAVGETQRFVDIIWPTGNDHFSEAVYSFANIASELEQLVRRIIFESYGVEKYYDSNIRSTDNLFRANKYNRINMQETNIGIKPHTDKNFMTIISNLDDGLEMKTTDGNWIGVPPLPSSFVVLAGETLLAWSNCRIKSPVHRVLMSGKPERYSLMLFVSCDGTIEVPEELVDEEHPLQFTPFDQFTFLNRYAAKRSKQELAVLEYYGILP